MPCFICQKHAGNVAPPPGGYTYDDELWKVAHAPRDDAAPGTLLLESKRHFLDFAEMNSQEAATYGPLLRRLYGALKQVRAAERIYSLMLLEGVPHFHIWLIPRPADSKQLGLNYVTASHTTPRGEAVEIVRKLRQALQAEEE